MVLYFDIYAPRKSLFCRHAVHLEVAGTEHTLVQIVVTVDPKMQIPTWLFNLVVKNLAFLIMARGAERSDHLREREVCMYRHTSDGQILAASTTVQILPVGDWFRIICLISISAG